MFSDLHKRQINHHPFLIFKWSMVRPFLLQHPYAVLCRTVSAFWIRETVFAWENPDPRASIALLKQKAVPTRERTPSRGSLLLITPLPTKPRWTNALAQTQPAWSQNKDASINAAQISAWKALCPLPPTSALLLSKVERKPEIGQCSLPPKNVLEANFNHWNMVQKYTLLLHMALPGASGLLGYLVDTQFWANGTSCEKQMWAQQFTKVSATWTTIQGSVQRQLSNSLFWVITGGLLKLNNFSSADCVPEDSLQLWSKFTVATLGPPQAALPPLRLGIFYTRTRDG